MKSFKQYTNIKEHSMDCGDPDCYLCGNPRHIHKHGETKQEKSFAQTDKWQTE